MKSCSTSGCGKILGILRILLGLGMLYFGVMKLTNLPDALAIGNAAHLLGFDFLSITVWGWIAIVGEILAGLILLFGCPKCVKFGSFMTAIIMVFALNMGGWDLSSNWKAWLFFVVAMIILIWGAGARTLCSSKGKCCGKSCDNDVVEA